MKTKRTSQSAFLNPRALISLLLCTAAAGWMLSGTMLAFLRSEAPTQVPQRTLTFAGRVAYQRAIEDVYWRHRIWQKDNPEPKPSLDAVMSQAQLEKKVRDYLRNSQALEDYWQRPITAEQLQAEMDRMAQHTKQPEVLRELFESLDNDPFVIAECLARPAFSERLLTSWYANDQGIRGTTCRTSAGAIILQFGNTAVTCTKSNSTSTRSPLFWVQMSVDILYSTDLRRPLAFALALVWWR
jgi:hypothetical protein